MDRLILITFDDDNHAKRIFINGKYVGNLSNIGKVFENSINIIKDLNDDYKFEETHVWVCDDFDEVDGDIVDAIWEFFDNVEQMTEAQIKLIQNKDWVELNKNIKKAR